MKKVPKSLVCQLSATFLFSLQASAAAMYWDGGGGDADWHNTLNWDLDRLPLAADTIALNNATVNVSTLGAFGGFAIATAPDPDIPATGTLNINSGGDLTSGGSFSGVRYATVNVNDGGTFTLSNVGGQIRGPLTVAQGGLLIGGRDIRDARTLTVNGTWRRTVSDNKEFLIGGAGGASTVTLGSTGLIEMKVFADNDNQNMRLGRNTDILNLTQGTIELVIEGAYTPLNGHSFTLWDNAIGGTVNTGVNGPNFTMPGLGSGLSLDTSGFATTGVVTVIPEPSALVLLALSGLAMMLVRRRK